MVGIAHPVFQFIQNREVITPVILFLQVTEILPLYSQPETQEIETKVLVVGNAVLVPVKLGYRGKKLSTWLVFDTGATTTTLHKNVGDELDIIPITSGKLTIADGTLIDTQKAILDYIIVGPYRRDTFNVVIIDNKNDSNMVKGLLGMNFLKNMNYKIDFTRKLIKWSNK
jgi:predicted aspartyl protease